MDEIEKLRIVGQSERVLTNYFTGNMKNILDKLQFVIKCGYLAAATEGNKAAGMNAMSVALMTGHYDMDGLDASNELHHHDMKQLIKAVFSGINAVLDDMTAAEVTAKGITPYVDGAKSENKEFIIIKPVNADLPLRPALRYLRHNPRYIKSITITTNNAGVFDGSFSLGDMSPFHRTATREVDLTQYKSVNQYANDKIVINYGPQEFQLNEDVLWTLNGIPVTSDAVTEITMSIEFYDE